MPYDAITAMLGSDAGLFEVSGNLLNSDVADMAELQPAASQHHPVDIPSVRASSSTAKADTGVAFTDAAETAGPDADTHWLSAFPSVPASSATSGSISKPAAAATETEEDLFARLTALKANPAAPAEDMATLTDRLAALKGSKVSAAELLDLQSRLEDLKGGKNSVPLSELEGRLAKLKGTSHAPTGRLAQVHGQICGELIPDFDPDVELNQEQLEALASMGDSYAENAPLETCLAESNVQAKARQKSVQSHPMPTSKSKPHVSSVTNSSEVRHLLQEFESEGDEGISDQQLKALASMQARDAAGVPQWAAALGLSAHDLHAGSEPDVCSQSDSSGSASNGSSDHVSACDQGRRVLVGRAVRQAQQKRFPKQSLPRQTGHSRSRRAP